MGYPLNARFAPTAEVTVALGTHAIFVMVQVHLTGKK